MSWVVVSAGLEEFVLGIDSGGGSTAFAFRNRKNPVVAAGMSAVWAGAPQLQSRKPYAAQLSKRV